MVATITMSPSKPHRIAFLFVTGLGALGAVLFACSSPTVPPVGTPFAVTTYLAGEVIREVGGEKKRLSPWIVE